MTKLDNMSNPQIISGIQVREILQREFPEINSELEKLTNPNNIYKTIDCFVDFTRNLINAGKLRSVKGCFKLAERMLDDGNNTVKNAIENVYVYSLGIVIDLSVPTANKLKKIFNGSLKKEYYRQVSASGV
jgi:hypothetical protein